MGDARRHADALEPGARHDQRIRRSDLAAVGKPLLVAAIELCHAGIGSATVMNHGGFGEQPAQIGGAAHRIGADLEALALRCAKLLQREAGTQHQRVVGGVARQRRRDDQAWRLLVAGDVLERVHRRLQLPGPHRLANFGDERAALAAMAQQLAGLILIATGFELDDLDVEGRIGRAEQPRDRFRLRQRHHALARADPQGLS